MPKSKLADYSVGWICALPQEFAAARAMLDDEHGVPESRDAADRNAYSLGRIGAHNVVLACLPAGVPGATPAATVAMDMQRTFRGLRFGLLVGVGSGAPSADDDVRLGDVVVSRPTHDNSGVIQFERALPNMVDDNNNESGSGRRGRFLRSQCLNAPPTVLLTVQTSLEAEHMISGSKICDVLAQVAQKYPRLKSQFAAPHARRGCGSSSSDKGRYGSDAADQLFEASYVHQGGHVRNGVCGQCDAGRVVQRQVRETDGPQVHYGVIASGDEEIACGVTRDAAKAALGALCFEREAAGLMNNFPCLVIRGISDYADSHKSKCWLGYAAAAAAACAKELLEIMSPQEVQDMDTIAKLLNEGPSFAPSRRDSQVLC